MKDAYSFDVDFAGLDVSYEKQFQAYQRIFARLQLDVIVVEAEAGAIGGFGTREFMLPTPSGEDTIIQCDRCGYASNVECAVSRPAPVVNEASESAADSQPQLVETPGARTIEAVTAFLQRPPTALIKTLLYRAGERFVAALIRGDRTLNEMKLAKAVGDAPLRMAEPEEIRALTGAEVGYSGPIGLPADVEIIADWEIEGMREAVVGANRTDAHLVGVCVGRDFTPARYADLREAQAGDACAQCEGGTLQAIRGIELGHVFKLGTKYSEALGAYFQDEHGQQRPIVMGCYGIGVSRIIAALVERWHDEKGICWPLAVAPFAVAVLLLDPREPALTAIAEDCYQRVQTAGFDVLLDDRDERPGVKFKDAELIGYPLVIVVGNKARQEGVVEVRRRRDNAERVVPIAEAIGALQELAQDA